MSDDDNYSEFTAEQGRLTILKALAKQTDGRLNDALLARILDGFGYNKSREWVRTQMLALAELGAVQLTEAGTVLVATLKRTGADHVERRTILDGVARPDWTN